MSGSVPLTGSAAVPGSSAAAGPVAVVDVGSNSVRLVVYDRIARAPLTLYNEKAVCGLGRGLGQDGALDPAAIEHAVATVARFAALTRAMGVSQVMVVATAAVRDAANGQALAKAMRARTGLPVRVLSGAEEARFAALGVVAASPGARGLVGDLGGGSLELVALEDGEAGDAVTLPLGPLRLAASAGGVGVGAREVLDRALAGVPWLAGRADGALYIVGGAWRALARVHMARTGYPVQVLHGYEVGAAEFATLTDLLAHLSRASLQRIEGVSQERLDTLPLAALTLRRLLAESRASKVVFSAYGLREGLLFDRLSPAQRQSDPLLESCRAMSARDLRFDAEPAQLVAWTGPLFAGESEEELRLRTAAAHLSEIAWRVHPDHRAEHALLGVLHGPMVGLDHRQRILLALAAQARYSVASGGGMAERVRRLVPAERVGWARRVGLSLRLALTLCGGAPALLSRARLASTSRELVLTVDQDDLLSDVVRRRFETLAKAADRKARLAGTAG